MTAKTYPDGGATAVYYAYDNRNLQLYARYSSVTGEGVTNSYDGFGRLASAASNMGGTSRTLTYAWDADGDRIEVKHPDGNYFGTVHDGLDRPFYMHSNWTAGIAYDYYDAAGEVTTSTRVGVEALYSYDALGRLGALIQGSAWGGSVMWTFARNPAGQIAAETRDNDTYAWGGHYAVNRGYTTNGLNQYTAAGGASFTYDANGNLTSDGTRTYAYDIENRMVSSSNGAALAYDPLGRLWQVTLGSATTRFLYDGDALVAEYNAAGTLVARHAHWPGADVPMVSYAGADLAHPTQLLADVRGSIVTLADGSGALSGFNRYDEYGIPAATNTGRFQYTGQVWLSELGMYYYKARIYSPTLGRFMQTDPVGYEDQFNLYEYVGNDPINRADPTGEFTIVYHGTRTEREQLRAIVLQAAKSDPELGRRYNVLEQSHHVHDVSAIQPIFPRPESRPTGPNAVANTQNGVGTGTRVTLSLEPMTLHAQGVNGSDIPASPGDIGTHELFSHSYDFDQGIAAAPDALGLNLEPLNETVADGIENIYRRANDEPQRIRHSPEEPW